MTYRSVPLRWLLSSIFFIFHFFVRFCRPTMFGADAPSVGMWSTGTVADTVPREYIEKIVLSEKHP